MAVKSSLKTAIFVSFGIAIILSACLQPVDFQAFINDPKISGPDGIIEKNKAKVKIHDDSDDKEHLVPGDRFISGLTPGKYYRVEEYENDIFKRNLFIKANGEYYSELSEIGLLEGDKIKNLTNLFTYKIKSAQPFNNGNHDYFAFGDTKPESAAVKDGAISIRGAKKYYLDLAPEIKINKNYEVMNIPKTGTWDYSQTSSEYIGPTGSISNINKDMFYPNKIFPSKDIGIYQYSTAVSTGGIVLQNRSIIELPEVKTQSDFVFAEYEEGSDKKNRVTNFYVLSIERPDDIKIQVSVSETFSSDSPDKPPQVVISGLDPVTQTINYTSNDMITITVTNNIYTSYKWYVDGFLKEGNTNVYKFDMSDVFNKLIGDFVITVEGVIDGIPYSKTDIKISVVK
jgi:hypothetical protein